MHGDDEENNRYGMHFTRFIFAHNLNPLPLSYKGDNKDIISFINFMQELEKLPGAKEIFKKYNTTIENF